MKKKVVLIVVAIVALIMVFAVVYALVSDPEGVQESLTETESQSVSDTVPDTSEPSSVLTSDMPIISGSNAYDFTESLEQNGMPEAERTSTTDGYSFSSVDADYSYSIETDTEYQISYGRFMVLSEDNGFLGFCASFPCDANSGTEAQSWVNNHIGKETSTTIGNAEFILSNGTQGPILEIKAIGRDDYVQNQIASEN